MRAYKVSCTADVESNDGVGVCLATKTVTKYAGTQALMRAARQDLVDTHGVMKKDVQVEEVEIPMAKAALLEFINSLVEV